MANVTRLLDTLRDEHAIKSDAALARKLGMTPPDISKARKSGALSDRLLVRICERFSLQIEAVRKMAA